jgi:golgi phosphoprotein 3
MVSLYEELFLLTIDEEKGNFINFTKKTLPAALGGTVLAELALRGKLCSNPKQRLELADNSPTGDDILDEVIRTIDSAEKPRKILYWVNLFSEHPKKLRLAVGESLSTRGLVHQDENHFYWMHSPENESISLPTKFEMKNPLRAIIFAGGEVDPHGIALLTILNAAGLLSLIFTADEIPTAKRLIYEKTMGAALGSPDLETVEYIGYAVQEGIEEGGE